MAYSVNKCHSEIDYWKEQSQKAARELEHWARELQIAIEEEADKAKRAA